jgi:hypothetical protein
MQRLKSAIWVAAWLRRVQGLGLMATILRRGAEEAGAVFIKVARLDGTADLYGPAPQSAFDEDAGERLFELILSAVPDAEVEERLRREARFDPDLWAAEVEDRQGRALVDLAKPDPVARKDWWRE